MKKVVIVGGGFAGLNVAKSLGNHKDFAVTLIDRRNHHLFQPLLYQVSMAGLSPAEIAVAIRGELRQSKNITVILGNVSKVDLNQRRVTSESGDFEYDYLVMCCGATHSYFGNEHWEPHAPGLKTLEQATEIRRRVLVAFEWAERERDPEVRKKYLTFVVVGGGPTGVELAGALGEISRHTLSSDFRNINPDSARIILVEGGSRILSSFHSSLSKKATRALEQLGVQVWTNSIVSEVSEAGVQIGNEFISSRTVLWAAGVQAAPINKTLGVPLDRVGRIIVDADLSIPQFPDVFVLGDQASFKTENGDFLPGLAPVAIQQGRFLGKMLKDIATGKPRRKFRYEDKGQMATIGRREAVMQYKKFKTSGFIAWVLWLVIHIYYLIGFKKRLIVLIHWIVHYFSYSKGARLIVYKEWRTYYKTKEQPNSEKPVPVDRGI